MYRVDMACDVDYVGSLYGVITKRRGRIFKEEMKEGTQIFMISAYLPVAQSFGFSQSIRQRTGGNANPQLQ
jgi:ribosome assembly protein 1